MNPSQQQAHTTRMDEVEAAVARFGEAVLGKIADLEAEIAGLRRALDDERRDRRAAGNLAMTGVWADLVRFTGMGCWARLAWLLRGW